MIKNKLLLFVIMALFAGQWTIACGDDDDSNADTDSDTDTDSDSDPTTSGSEYGDDCDADNPCLGDISNCELAPPNKAGTCTTADCTPDSCPSTYTCLDCAEFQYVGEMESAIFCATEEVTDQMLAYGCVRVE